VDHLSLAGLQARTNGARIDTEAEDQGLVRPLTPAAVQVEVERKYMHTLARILGLGTVLMGVLSAATLPSRAAAPDASIPRCPSGRLYIAPVPKSGQGGVGHVGLVFSVKSLAQQPCYLEGYPGLQMVDASGHNIATRLRWGGGYLFGNQPKRSITLTTGQVATFDLEWVHIPTGNQNCPTASYLLVTPPDETAAIAVAVSLQQVCGGALTASPVIAPGS
jgi:hypothetical protein